MPAAVAIFLVLDAASFPTKAQNPAASSSAYSGADTAAGDELNEGVEAHKAARYDEAISHFRKATELDPASHLAKVYLATALAMNIVPGLDTPENLKTAQQATDIFKTVLNDDPHDVNSMKQIAGIYFSMNKLDDAKEWQKRVLAEDPKDPEAAYTIGVIDWTEAHQNALKALQSEGLNDDGEGNMNAPATVMEQLIALNGPLVAEAIEYLTHAIENRPNYDDAMAYLNLVYRRKADLDHGNEAARKNDLAQADGWRQKAMQTRKANEQKRRSGPGSAQQ